MSRKHTSFAAYLIISFIVAALTGCAETGRVYKPTVKPLPRAAEAETGSKIKWEQWGAEAFRRAEQEDKLVFLDISASWCHWCMVMEEETYSDPRVIELLNRDFVPVYVDTDKRPDINDRYNQGGWPSVALLTPKGQVLSGKTTLTADELLMMLQTVDTVYDATRDDVLAKLRAKEQAVEEAKEEFDSKKRTRMLGAEMPFKVLKAVNLFVDSEYGGYGGPDKFPMPEIMRFALDVYPKVKQSEEYSPEKAIRVTLDNMAKGILDPVEGGFFRYSTSVDWKSPHYEKMLALNGDMLGAYMHAYRTLGDPQYRKVGESVAGYMEGVLLDHATGAFYGSQAADERYYRLDYAGRVAAGAPPLDYTVYADANARAALGFLEAFRATGDPRYLLVAKRTVEYIMTKLAADGGIIRHTESADGVLLLSDHVYTGLAAETLYQATGDSRYLRFAMDVAGGMTANFWDSEKGGFFDSAYDSEPQGLLADRTNPQAENSKAAMFMTELYHITGEKAYRETAKHTLMPYTAEYAKYTFYAAPFARAATRCVETAYEFIVVGPPTEPATRALITKAFMFDDPDRVVVVLDPAADKARMQKLGYEYEGSPMMYVCSERACFPPVGPDGSMDKTREFIKKAREQAAE